MELEGIQFIVNAQGEKTALVIDLIEHSLTWEDYYDGLIAESRRGEPSVSLEELRANLGLDADAT
jgi:hypothetical protein